MESMSYSRTRATIVDTSPSIDRTLTGQNESWFDGGPHEGPDIVQTAAWRIYPPADATVLDLWS
jgi:hypothetical protein